MVYILYSICLDRYYIGSTENIDERLKKHLSSHKGFTSKAKDWKIRYFEEISSNQDALKREMQLKRWKNRTRIEKLIMKRTVG